MLDEVKNFHRSFINSKIVDFEYLCKHLDKIQWIEICDEQFKDWDDKVKTRKTTNYHLPYSPAPKNCYKNAHIYKFLQKTCKKDGKSLA